MANFTDCPIFLLRQKKTRNMGLIGNFISPYADEKYDRQYEHFGKLNMNKLNHTTFILLTRTPPRLPCWHSPRPNPLPHHPSRPPPTSCHHHQFAHDHCLAEFSISIFVVVARPPLRQQGVGPLRCDSRGWGGINK